MDWFSQAEMPSLPMALLFVALGTGAGFLNVLAGGGSLLTMPMLIFAGLPETVANGTARLAILFQNVSAVTRYHRAGTVPWEMVRPMLLPVLLGATAGAGAATVVSDLAFRNILGVVMLGVAVVVVANPAWLGGETDGAGGAGDALPSWLRSVLLTGVGFYGGMIQAGVGYVILATLVGGLRMSLVRANVLKVVLVGLYMPIVLAIFIAGGKVHLVYAALLAVGQVVGAWLGASTALKKGAAAIRKAVMVAVVLTALKLLGVADWLVALLSG